MQLRFSLGVLAVLVSASVGAQPGNTFPGEHSNTFTTEEYTRRATENNTNALTAEPGGNAFDLDQGIGALRAKDTENTLTAILRRDGYGRQGGEKAGMAFVGVGSEKSYKAGSQQTLQWTGGANTERLRLEVYQEGDPFPVRVQVIDSSFVNTGEISFTLSKKLKPGRKYYYLLTTESGDGAVKSEGFSLKKIPLWVKIAVPVVVVTGVIVLITGSKSSSSLRMMG